MFNVLYYFKHINIYFSSWQDRHLVPSVKNTAVHFPSILKDLRLRLPLLSKRGNININHFIPLKINSGNRHHNLRVYSHTFVPLHHEDGLVKNSIRIILTIFIYKLWHFYWRNLYIKLKTDVLIETKRIKEINVDDDIAECCLHPSSGSSSFQSQAYVVLFRYVCISNIPFKL